MIVEVGGMDRFSVLGVVGLEGCVCFPLQRVVVHRSVLGCLVVFFYVLTTVGPK